ncbi:MAG: hypothetical protein KDD53_12625, partial [Bdellovibrionales bacterium]|nr:hypothetical protein [Bdellovibrionales bacterium]
MSSNRWVSFCAHDSLLRSIFHFFPSALGVTVPYPAECRISLFGDGFGMRQVVLQGARLNQPDGVRLEDAFPSLLESAPSLLGIEITITSP